MSSLAVSPSVILPVILPVILSVILPVILPVILSLPAQLVNSYTVTPYTRVLLEKLTGSQQVNKFPTFYGTRRFITALTSARHLSLS